MTEEKKTTAKHSKAIFSLLVIFIVVLGFVSAGWQIYSLRVLVNEMQKNQSVQKSTLENLQASFDQYTKTNITKNFIWILYRSKNFLELADISLHTNNDIAGAIFLLHMAQKDIVTINNPITVVTTIRQAISTDIAKLQALPQVNVAAITTKLNNIINQISVLPVNQPLVVKQPEPLPKPEKQMSLWEQFYDTSLVKLQDIVIIKHHEQPLKPILTEGEQVFARQNIQLAIEEAQWAVLHRDKDVYMASLKKANDIIAIYFSYNPAAGKEISKAIQALMEFDINPTLPSLDSISILEKTIQQLDMENSNA